VVIEISDDLYQPAQKRTSKNLHTLTTKTTTTAYIKVLIVINIK